MEQERTLREIVLLPELDREKEPRQTSSIKINKGFAIAFALVILLSFGGYGLYYRSALVTVPNVIGIDSDLAATRIEQAGLHAKIVERRFSAVKRGTVIDQSPKKSKRPKGNGLVSLVVSGGTEQLQVPNVVGENELYATRALTQLGLVPVLVSEPSYQEAGTVLSVSPVIGGTVFTGDAVTIRVSGGSQDIVLKDFDLKWKTISIVPLYSSNETSDITFDVARRLSSLFKAAGADVIVTRSAAEKKSSTSLLQEAYSRSDVLIQLAVRDAGSSGLVVSDPSQNSTQVVASGSVGSQVYGELKSYAQNVRLSSSKMASGSMSRKQAFQVSFGSLANATDAALMDDSQFKDIIARSLYLGVGGFLTP